MLTEKWTINSLDWDTEYFGVKSCKIILLSELDQNDLAAAMLAAASFDFTTIVNSGNLSQNNFLIGRSSTAFLVDINIQFQKTVEAGTFSSSYIRCSESEKEDLLMITRNAFIYSRFFNDPNLPEKQKLRIYCHWVTSALFDPSRIILGLRENNQVIGFLILAENLAEKATIIELIAVASDHSGRGIGRTLIQAANFHAYERNFKYLKVGTQVNNILAMNFYQACNFKQVACNSVYHYWPHRQSDLIF